MAAQTATKRMSLSEFARLAYLQNELAGEAAVELSTVTTDVRLTLVWTKATNAITIDREDDPA